MENFNFKEFAKTYHLKTILFLIITGYIIISCYSTVMDGYNNFVTKDESSSQALAQLNTAYQRRSDLIPQLVEVVQGTADFEKSTLEGVISARASATQITIDPKNFTQESLNQFQASQGAVSSSLSRLMVVVEKYPDLKSNEGFQQLQAQIEGSENRIAIERNNFNQTVQSYNLDIRTFPNSLIAKSFGFNKKAYFEAEKGAEKAPKFQFTRPNQNK